MKKKKSFWRGIGVSLLYVLIFFAVAQIVAIPVSMIGMGLILANNPDFFSGTAGISGLMKSPEMGELTLWSTLIADALVVIGIVVFFLIKKKNPLKQLEINKISPFTAILSVIAGLSICIFVEFALSLLPIPEKMFNTFDLFFDGIYKAPYWLIVLAVGIIGPICEEVVFRGGVMNTMRRECNPTAAIIISGVAFGLIHGIPLQVMYATFIGIILGIVFHVTKSLLTVIIIHIVNNIFSDFIEVIFTGWENPYIVLIIAAVTAALSISAMAVIERKRRYSVPEEEATI